MYGRLDAAAFLESGKQVPPQYAHQARPAT
jgi:hypothetical protein